jgi:hypothetical protein
LFRIHRGISNRDGELEETTMRIWLLVAVVIGLGAGPAGAAGHDEYQDSAGKQLKPTELVGMHACDGPHLMSGVHIHENRFLCIGVTGAVNGDVFRTISSATFSTVGGISVGSCPRQSAMKGIYATPIAAGAHGPTLMCSQVLNLGPVHIDHNTQRANMHACPPGEVMVGINIAQNVLACALPPP